MPFLLLYLFCINVLSFILMGIDKKKAQGGAWCISEKSLLLSAVAGGCIGGMLGMKRFRHKTKHRTFTLGMPCILLLQLLLVLGFIHWTG